MQKGKGDAFAFPIEVVGIVFEIFQFCSRLVRGEGRMVGGAYGGARIGESGIATGTASRERVQKRQKTGSGEKPHENQTRKITVQNQGSWRNRAAFCLSPGIFPFIVLHGQCPVPVVQWIERVSPKD